MTNVETFLENIVEELAERGYEVTDYEVINDETLVVEFDRFGFKGKMTIPMKTFGLV